MLQAYFHVMQNNGFSPFATGEWDYSRKPRSITECSARNRAIFEEWKSSSKTQKELSAQFGLTAGRVSQLIRRECTREARVLGVKYHDIVGQYRFYRRKNRQGYSYHYASAKQRYKLRVWETQARDVQQSCWEVEQSLRSLGAAMWTNRIIRIKRYYDRLTPERKAAKKPALAALIDKHLAKLRAIAGTTEA